MDQLTTQLQQLHDQYAEQVNLAVAEGRDELVEALCAEFTDAAISIMGTAPVAVLPDGA